MEDKTDKIIGIHDRIEELAGKIIGKCYDLFPQHYEEVAKGILFDRKNMVEDEEIQGWAAEILKIEAENVELNPWNILLNQ